MAYVTASVLLIVSVAVLLVASTATLTTAVHALGADGRALEALQRVEANLLRYVRQSNARILTGSPAREQAAQLSRARVEADMNTARDLADRPEEREEVAELRAQIDAYFARRESLQASGASLARILAETRTQLDGTLTRVRDLAAAYGAQREASEERSARVSVVTYAVAAAVGALVLAGVLGGGLVFRRQVAGPLRGVVLAIDRLRLGETAAEAPEEGPVELRRIVKLLNRTTAALAQQKKRQLTFLASVAHDLRNPLSALKMAIGSLRATEPGTDEVRERTLSLLERQIDRLERMIGDLLDSTRIEAGELSLSFTELDLRDPAREMVDLYRPTSPSHRIELSLPGGPVIVRADALRMEQVLSNLLSNAVKYSPRGGVVRVGVAATEREAVLSVSDQGMGIPAENLEDIFLPFQRSPQTHHLTGGAGLGLSVLRRIVAAHGGRVEVQSEPNVGSTFRVLLPLAYPDLSAPADGESGAATDG